MSQKGDGYHAQAVANKESAQAPITKDIYLTKLFEKQTQVLQEVAREAMNQTMDQFIQGLIYHGDPVITQKKGDANAYIEKHNLKERKKEIEESMHMLMTRYDLLSKHEYHDKLKELQSKFKDVEQLLVHNSEGHMIDAKTALSAQDLMGLENRRAMTLAEQAFAKTKEDLEHDQAEAAKFVHKMNEKRADIERRKKETQDKEAKKLHDQEEKQRIEKEEKEVKDKEDRKQKLEFLKKDIINRDEQRKKDNEETKQKIKEVLTSKPLYKVKAEIIRDMENSELEKKKERLKSLRSLSKPLDLDELAQHKQKYLEQKSVKDRELTDKREKIMLEIEDKNRNDHQLRSKYNLVGRQAALDRFFKEREEVLQKDKIKDEERKKMSERVTNYSRYVKEMYYPKVSKEKHDEIENIISKLKINLSSEDLKDATTPGMRKTNSIIKLREVKSSLNSPSRQGKSRSALKTLDKYAAAVQSILEKKEEEAEREKYFIDWAGKKNSMKKEKYVPPEPTQFHDNTLGYLDKLREKRRTDGVNVQAQFIDRMINDPNLKEYDRLHVVRQHAQFLESKAKRDEFVMKHTGNSGVDKEMEVNDMYLDAISAKLKLLDKI